MPVQEATAARWLSVITAARWVAETPTWAETLRCGVCRREFGPGAAGAATFTEEARSITLRSCPRCVQLLVIVPRGDDSVGTVVAGGAR
jgi:hypothetical protein